MLCGPGRDGAAAGALGGALPGDVAQAAVHPSASPASDRGALPHELLPPPPLGVGVGGIATGCTVSAAHPGAGHPLGGSSAALDRRGRGPYRGGRAGRALPRRPCRPRSGRWRGVAPRRHGCWANAPWAPRLETRSLPDNERARARTTTRVRTEPRMWGGETHRSPPYLPRSRRPGRAGRPRPPHHPRQLRLRVRPRRSPPGPASGRPRHRGWNTQRPRCRRVFLASRGR